MFENRICENCKLAKFEKRKVRNAIDYLYNIAINEFCLTFVNETTL